MSSSDRDQPRNRFIELRFSTGVSFLAGDFFLVFVIFVVLVVAVAVTISSDWAEIVAVANDLTGRVSAEVGSLVWESTEGIVVVVVVVVVIIIVDIIVLLSSLLK